MIFLDDYFKENLGYHIDIEKITFHPKTTRVDIKMRLREAYLPSIILKIEKKMKDSLKNFSSVGFTYESGTPLSLELKQEILLDFFRMLPSFKKYNLTKIEYDEKDQAFDIMCAQEAVPGEKQDLKVFKKELFRIYGWHDAIRFKFLNQKDTIEDYVIDKENEENAYILNHPVNIEENFQKSVSSHEIKKEIHQWRKFNFDREMPTAISSLSQQSNKDGVLIRGELIRIDFRDIKNDKCIVIMDISDKIEGITAKAFVKKNEKENFFQCLSLGDSVAIYGKMEFDSYLKSEILMAAAMKKFIQTPKTDHAQAKRIELHAHTQMSDMDGIVSAKSLIKMAADWGHKAIGITDHGVVQAFPDAMEAGKKNNIKILYGMEGYLMDEYKILSGESEYTLDDTFVVFDIETTGFSPYHCKIIEIGAVKIKNRQIVERYSQLINPRQKLPYEIVELTKIDDGMLEGQPEIEEIKSSFISFCEDAVLVAHNADFDMSFIRRDFPEIQNAVIDTLSLSRVLVTEIKRHGLSKLTKFFNINLEHHHRAVDDAEATCILLLKLFERLDKLGRNKVSLLNELIPHTLNIRYGKLHHIILYAQNNIGLKNLYHIVSESHLNYFYDKPKIPRFLLEEYKEGLLLGSACQDGEVYQSMLQRNPEDKTEAIIQRYDYIELQPLENYSHLLGQQKVQDMKEIVAINQKIYALSKKHHKPVVATGDVHYLLPEESVYRDILTAGKKFDEKFEKKGLYFKTTEEMFEGFSYFSEEIKKEIIVDNPLRIADSIEAIKPIPDETFPPKIEGSESELKELSFENAQKLYGDPLPEKVKSRLERELKAIIGNGYAVLYMIAQKLVKRSMDDGYLVGSRGSVGSSFVATMSNITEVNPLTPHYLCPKCHYVEFVEDNEISSGVDMPHKNCPKCGHILDKHGFDIPFETFLGFEADKEPDIDLNFASEEQSVAHRYTEELFGEGHVFRAGTIGTIAEKTAYGYVKKYLEEKNLAKHPAEIQRLTLGCAGVKRTTGQHPGGVMVVPSDKDIHDFTPIQYPANDKSSGVKTTHFDYHSISGRILKLDILGHDTPTIIRMLEDFTGTNSLEIPLDDEKTMGIFLSTAPLDIHPKDIDTEVGTLGIPEFGTPFVRQMLIDTKPSTFSELVRISGLSHGTDVWVNNAQELVRSNTITLKEVISTRDDIMIYLIQKGLDKKMAFTIMENVRKGKGLKPEEEETMLQNNVPKWYVESCKKIKYLFPKAHAVAYVTMSFRIAYYKVHHPAAFYATYFTMKASDFDADLICKGREKILEKMKELNDLGNDKTAKDKNLLTVLEVAEEMYLRNISLLKVDIYQSSDKKFVLEGEGIRPPLVSLQGIGETAAESIYVQRQKGEFLSVEDLVARTKINKNCVENLKNHGCLKGISDTNQLNLFDF